MMRYREVFIEDIGIDVRSRLPVVILREKEGKRRLPIFVGAAEYQAIAIRRAEVAFSRPLSHALMKDIIRDLDAELIRVSIERVQDNTYYALLHLQRWDAEFIFVDARPSDAIALALYYGAKIFVKSDLLQNMEINMASEEPSSDESDAANEREDHDETEGDDGDVEVLVDEGEIEPIATAQEEIDRMGGLSAIDDVEMLRVLMDMAASQEEEDYELAARIRDRIARLLGEDLEE